MTSKSELCPCCNEATFSKLDKVLTFWGGRECPNCHQTVKVGGALYKFLAVVLHWGWLLAALAFIFVQTPFMLGVVIGIFVLDYFNKAYIGQFFPK